MIREHRRSSCVSLVVPVRNEQDVLPTLINSIRQQTRQPDEAILVDGGSRDQTVQIMQQLTADDPRFRVLEAEDATPGKGRNVGIAAARYDWIALTDAGIRLESTWLERLMQVVERDPTLSVVYGNYEPEINSFFFERCAALAYVPPKQQRANGWMRGPSIVSALIRRDAWAAIGGFPDLRAAEDLIFMERIHQYGFNIGWAPTATAWWQLQPTLGATFRKFVTYSKHNVWVGREWDWHYGVAWKYLAGLFFVLLAIAHNPWWLVVPLLGGLARVAKKTWNQREGHALRWLLNPIQFAGVAVILISIDLATFVGWGQGIWHRKSLKKSTAFAVNFQKPMRIFSADANGKLAKPVSGATSAVYLSYDGALEPLGQSQVIPYLDGLSREGICLTLITFEKPGDLRKDEEIQKIHERLDHSGIRWIRLRYHRQPTLASTAWDVLIGSMVGIWTVFGTRAQIVHGRSYVAGAMALVITVITNTNFIFDMRGFWPEERVEGNIWSANGLLYRLSKILEKCLFSHADEVVVLTQKGKEILTTSAYRSLMTLNPPVTVIPCCVDVQRFGAANRSGANLVRALGLEEQSYLVYAGSLGTWYMLDEMLDFFLVAKRAREGLRFLILNRGEHQMVRVKAAARGLGEQEVVVAAARPDQVPGYLTCGLAGIYFIKPTFSKQGTSPTKLAEYLACGLPVVANPRVGDIDELLSIHRVGVLAHAFATEAYRDAVLELNQLLRDPELWQRCRGVATQHLSLETGVAKYHEVYIRLLGTLKA